MLISFLVLVLAVMACVRIRKGSETGEYLSKESCASVKGVFICYVLLRHAWPYLSLHGYDFPFWGDRLFLRFDDVVQQLLVVMFLFYSGYGIAESVARCGREYVRTIPRRRILSTLLNFDVAVLVFIAVDCLLGIRVGLRQCALSFVCWDSVGNSNWYIFAILVCYAVSFCVYALVKDLKFAAWVVAFVIGVCVVALSCLRPCWWYSTMATFVTGVMYSAYRRTIENAVRRFYWPLLFVLLIILFALPNSQMARYGIPYNIKSTAFALTVVLLSMRLKVVGPFFSWCGNHLFPLYIYQRIPMIILAKCVPLGILTFGGGGLLFVALSALFTGLIALWYRKWEIVLK